MTRQRRKLSSCVLFVAGAFVTSSSLLPPAVWAFSARTLIRVTGEAGGDFFGNSVSMAGDVNGDGYDDVIVGAYSNDAGGGSAGRAYIYYGGPGADTVADLTLTGGAGDFFGASVATAGDMNGDGYDDVIVGANLNDAGGADAGRAYVYYGGPAADTIADLTLTGAAPGDLFGASVSTAGDVNGDGYDDVIVGAHFNDAGGTDAGRAYIYYGGATSNNIADLILTGAVADDLFGYSVSTAGDVNGDRYADVIVGAPNNDFGGADAGRAYVYYGGSTPNNIADLVLTGAVAGDFFGASVSTAGDVNADAYADVIVGAYFNDAGGSDAGRAYVYHGGPAPNSVPDLILTGAAASDYFGFSVSSAGDINRDGYDDVIVGAYLNDAGGANAGRAYVYCGGPGADAIADLTLTGAAAGDNFGISASAAGDVNADGYDDVIVGAGGNDAAGVDAGRAYVQTSRPYEVRSPNGGEQWVIGREHPVRWLGADRAELWISFDGGATYSLLASEVGGADTNEFTLTAPSPETREAKIRVSASGEPVTFASSDASDGVFGIVRPAKPPSAAARLQVAPIGEAAGDQLGISASGAGDMNGDGYADIIVGAWSNDAGGTNAGRAYVYFGGPGADATADLTLTGEGAFDFFGISVSDAGDVNGDGYADVIVGAYANDAGGAEAGRAYLYYGGPGADAAADMILTGAAPQDQFGVSVSGAGDVNGDGNADVIVGASLNDAGGLSAGGAYVFYGGPGADAVADLVLTGQAANDQMGVSVSGAGDVNGDGYADVIVGAHSNDVGGIDAGRAYVYYGGPGADAVPDLTLTGAAAGDIHGYAVSGAGDVNGDGYADVIVGAHANDAGGPGAGRAYVYHGGPGADAIPDLILTGAAPGDNLGISVSDARDVNGDGSADLVVGAVGNDAGGADAGRAYVYYGGPGMDARADLVLTGASAADYFGISVSGLGDWNGDGCADVVVGAYLNEAGGANAGRAYAYDVNRYQLLSPTGGETWNVGALKTLSWLGAEPADVWLSTDGGETHELLRSRAGGGASNTISVRVPHAPTKFALVRLTPSDATWAGQDQSDSLFTIQTSVALLSMLAARLPEGGASITWQTDPGPEDLAGYRLERCAAGSSEWRTVVALTNATSVVDPSGGAGARYRLFAVNGFGEELWLGETSIRPLAPLSAWPLPYRGGNLSIAFATGAGLGGAAAPSDLSLYDVSGRLVRRIAGGVYPAGYHSAVWDGRDGRGGMVASGIYFLRSASAGEERSVKVVIAR